MAVTRALAWMAIVLSGHLLTGCKASIQSDPPSPATNAYQGVIKNDLTAMILDLREPKPMGKLVKAMLEARAVSSDVNIQATALGAILEAYERHPDDRPYLDGLFERMISAQPAPDYRQIIKEQFEEAKQRARDRR